MKKLIFPIAVLVFVALFASCKKDYTCVCDDSYAPGSGYSYQITHSTRKAAEKSCKDHEAAVKIASGSGWSCNL